MSSQLIEPRVVAGHLIAPTRAEAIAAAFPRINTALPGHLLGLYFELAKIGSMTVPLSGFFLRAGEDLETWSDLDLACLSDGNLEKCVTHAQLMSYGLLREEDYTQVCEYDPGWDLVTPDGTPTRGMIAIAGAEMLILGVDDPYYDTPDDIRESNVLYWRPPESAHERLAKSATRRATFALFSALTGFEGFEDGDLAYNTPRT